ncbi:MAG: ABC transporter ATP-binding protein, partial [Acidimicrobiales bacterium]|nr:ABC transporter ATP-binding protein [Acidimicrobiales bacterium]
FVTSTADDALPIIALYVAAGFRLMPSISRLILAWTGIRSTTPALASVVEAIQSHVPREQQATSDLEEPTTGRISFEGVSFAHALTDDLVLRDVWLSIDQGESVALVGPSGAGKTTLVDVLLGLYEPDHGRVIIGDEDLAQIRTAWRRHVGYVGQDTFLLDGSYRSNVAFGVPDHEVVDSLVWECLEAAQLADLVRSKPDGLECSVGERGIRLSGGQRQRIGIARALYRQPTVLVFDEATSALDATTESHIGETVARLRGRVTVIAIAHRLSSISDFDRVVYMAEGQIVATGDFLSLLKTNADFAEMVAHSTLEVAGESRESPAVSAEE